MVEACSHSVDIIMTILEAFNNIIQGLPNVWDNVVLVFTGCDYRRDIIEIKQLLHRELRKQIYDQFLKDRPASTSSSTGASTWSNTAITSSSPNLRGPSPSQLLPRAATMSDLTDSANIPMVFLTTADNVCLIALGGARCDCEDHAQYLKTGLKRLWYEARKLKRWVLHAPEEENEFTVHV